MKPYEELKTELQRFLKCYNAINIYQFDFAVHYLPVYLALNELGPLPINYISHGGNDVATVRELLNNTNGFLEGHINIGLSEVFKCDKGCATVCFHGLSDSEYKQLFQKSIIERVPLWGISRQNNPKINSKQYDVSKKDISPYWNLFEGKFSLLKAEDFKDLSISIYPEGSTIYRLFNESIQANAVTPSGDKEGFDLLFDNKVDVCITINPWYGISQSIGNHTRIEIVYNHLGKPHPFTSLYIKQYQEIPKKRENDILSTFLDYLSLFVQHQIIRFYDAKDINYDKWAAIYCELVRSNNPSGSCPLSVFARNNTSRPEPSAEGESKCDSCISPTKAAIQILNDSRIYYHDIEDKQTSDRGSVNLEREVLHCELLKFLETGELTVNDDDFKTFFPYHSTNNVDRSEIEQYLLGYADPILKLSDLCNELDEELHADITFVNYCPQLTDNVNLWIFGLLCKHCDIELNNVRTEDIHSEFKINASWLGDLFDYATLSENSLGGNIVYFQKQAFKKVFKRLRANKKDMGVGIADHPQPKIYFKLTQIQADAEPYLFSIILESKPIKTYLVSQTDFVTKEKNELGHKILSGWHIAYDQNIWKAEQFFKRPAHGGISINNTDGNLTYKDNDKSAQIILMPSLDKTKHYWCFIFKIVSYKKARTRPRRIG